MWITNHTSQLTASQAASVATCASPFQGGKENLDQHQHSWFGPAGHARSTRFPTGSRRQQVSSGQVTGRRLRFPFRQALLLRLATWTDRGLMLAAGQWAPLAYMLYSYLVASYYLLSLALLVA